ncbi:unnamed protein product [Arabidopsis arenosa]|uniref:Pentatricopeptide repeat-containing protein n=1 Tax=Arabidopsis arenosa TaxID=38785 RepID=A0A8S2B2D0_ARAAE|nr:unnamed protein product [Arabidopsis arenosa]
MLKLLLLQHRTSSPYFCKFQFFTFRLFSQSPSLSNSASSLLSLSSSSLAEAILKCRSAEEAFKLFETSSISRVSKTTDLQSFSAVIHVLTGAHKYTLARCLIKRLIERHSEPTNVSHRVFNALEDIQSPKFSIGVFSLLIMEFLEMGLFEEALWVSREMKCSPDSKACLAILNGLVSRRKFDSVWVDYQLMISRGLVPDVHIYSVLIQCCFKQRFPSKKEKLFDEMTSLGIKPNVYIYTIYIRDLCRDNKMEEAEKMFELMKKHGVVPNLYTYCAMIDGYCKTGNLRQAYGLYKEILVAELLPNVVVFGTLEANMKEALRLYSDMLEAGIHPNDHTFACLVDGFWKEGRVSDAIDFYLENNQSATGKSVAQRSCWNHLGFTCLIEGLCQNGYILRASRFFSDMRSVGVTPDIWSYVSMLKGHLREKRITDTMMLHCDMIKTGILPNLMVNQLLAMFYQENGCLRSACFLTNSGRLGTIS